MILLLQASFPGLTRCLEPLSPGLCAERAERWALLNSKRQRAPLTPLYSGVTSALPPNRSAPLPPQPGRPAAPGPSGTPRVPPGSPPSALPAWGARAAGPAPGFPRTGAKRHVRRSRGRPQRSPARSSAMAPPPPSPAAGTGRRCWREALATPRTEPLRGARGGGRCGCPPSLPPSDPAPKGLGGVGSRLCGACGPSGCASRAGGALLLRKSSEPAVSDRPSTHSSWQVLRQNLYLDLTYNHKTSKLKRNLG